MGAIEGDPQRSARQGMAAAGAGVAAAAVLVAVAFGGSGNGSANQAPHATATKNAEHPSHAKHETRSNHTATATKTARAVGGLTVFGVETSSGGDGESLRICTPGGSLFTVKSALGKWSLAALGDSLNTAGQTPSGVPCDISSGNAISNYEWGEATSGKVGAEFEITLAGDGKQSVITSITQVAPSGTVQ